MRVQDAMNYWDCFLEVIYNLSIKAHGYYVSINFFVSSLNYCIFFFGVRYRETVFCFDVCYELRYHLVDEVGTPIRHDLERGTEPNKVFE